MKKVAIVGVEGSGKTVMLAGLGELYTRPDANGYFMAPEDGKTYTYITDKIQLMRDGKWPAATPDDVMQGLNWKIRRKGGLEDKPNDVCEVSCLDFAGEVYRNAFGAKSEDGTVVAGDAGRLREYISNADDVIVLINLRDIISQKHTARTCESIFITNKILDFVMNLPRKRNRFRSDYKKPRVLLVLSQADSYIETIEKCGGEKAVLAKYAPGVVADFGWLDVASISAVDKTELTDEGFPVPKADFQAKELGIIMDWILDDVDNTFLGWPRFVYKVYLNGLKKFREIHGRTSRADYWKFLLAHLIVSAIALIGFSLVSDWSIWRGLLCVVLFILAFTLPSPREDEMLAFCVLWGVWFGLLLIWALISVCNTVMHAGHWSYIIVAVCLALELSPLVSISIRRLHDIKLCGWWMILCVSPIIGLFWHSWIVWTGPLVFFLLMCMKGTFGRNRFGNIPFGGIRL